MQSTWSQLTDISQVLQLATRLLPQLPLVVNSHAQSCSRRGTFSLCRLLISVDTCRKPAPLLFLFFQPYFRKILLLQHPKDLRECHRSLRHRGRQAAHRQTGGGAIFIASTRKPCTGRLFVLASATVSLSGGLQQDLRQHSSPQPHSRNVLELLREGQVQGWFTDGKGKGRFSSETMFIQEQAAVWPPCQLWEIGKE